MVFTLNIVDAASIDVQLTTTQGLNYQNQQNISISKITLGTALASGYYYRVAVAEPNGFAVGGATVASNSDYLSTNNSAGTTPLYVNLTSPATSPTTTPGTTLGTFTQSSNSTTLQFVFTLQISTDPNFVSPAPATVTQIASPTSVKVDNGSGGNYNVNIQTTSNTTIIVPTLYTSNTSYVGISMALGFETYIAIIDPGTLGLTWAGIDFILLWPNFSTLPGSIASTVVDYVPSVSIPGITADYTLHVSTTSGTSTYITSANQMRDTDNYFFSDLKWTRVNVLSAQAGAGISTVTNVNNFTCGNSKFTFDLDSGSYVRMKADATVTQISQSVVFQNIIIAPNTAVTTAGPNIPLS